MSNLIHFTVSPQVSTARDDVQAILEAHMARERAKGTRQFWIHLLAVVGGLLGMCLLFPEAASARLQAVLLALWGGCCACAVAAAAMEWRWERREARLLAANRLSPRG